MMKGQIAIPNKSGRVHEVATSEFEGKVITLCGRWLSVRSQFDEPRYRVSEGIELVDCKLCRAERAVKP